jgi:hypothetical protein
MEWIRQPDCPQYSVFTKHPRATCGREKFVVAAKCVVAYKV